MTDSTSKASNATPQMQLLWSSRSPFVRKVLIAAHEVGIGEQINLIPAFVSGKIPVPDVEALNPMGQIPTFVDVDGVTVFDSTAIIDYIDKKYGGGRLLPSAYPQRLDVLRRVALAQGIKEKSIRWISERLRPEEHRDAELIVGITRTINNALDSLETDAARWKEMNVDAGHIGLAAALGYLDFRFAQVAWRTNRPALEAWHDGFALRPSYIATEFVDPNKVMQPSTKS